MEQRIARIGRRLRALVRGLNEIGYRFENETEVMPGPEDGTHEAIREIEEQFGRCPRALKLFWEQIGSVDISGNHPDWIDDRYPDQLVVFPPSVAVSELHEYLTDVAEREKFGIPYEIPIAPDFYHKAGVSGGSPYTILMPCSEDDPPLNNSGYDESFLEHVERSLDCGGFPGMVGEAGHNWPLSKLIQIAKEGGKDDG